MSNRRRSICILKYPLRRSMEEEAEERVAVEEIIRREVGQEWDDEESDIMRGRYKGISGQRSDWEPLYLFWRNLIINISRQLDLFIIQPHKLRQIWFKRRGLTPLCLDHILIEMYKAGDLLCITDLPNPKTGRLAYTLSKIYNLITSSTSSNPPILTQHHLIISSLLRDKALEVVNLLSDNHWTSSCIITMAKFENNCGGPMEASAILSHLSACGKAKYLSVNSNNLIEGVKVSLSSKASVSSTSSDYNILHLTWTAEKLQQQLDVIDHRCDKAKKLALVSLRSGNKIVALRHAKEMKLTSESRIKCTKLLNRVEEVLKAIADAEDTNEVSKALQSGARAMEDINTTVEEVQLCLKELDEGINSQKIVEETLGSAVLYTEIEEEDIEDELEKLELAIRKKPSQIVNSDALVVGDGKSVEEEPQVSETAESLSHTLSKLKLAVNEAA